MTVTYLLSCFTTSQSFGAACRGLVRQVANFPKVWQQISQVAAISSTAVSILNRAARNHMCEALCHF